jgi:hypothetical protein
VPLSTRDRQQLSTRLAPAIGEQEAETLLDQFPSTTDADLATIADLKAEVARLDHRIDLLDAKLDLVEARLDGKIDVLRADMNAGFERIEKVINAKMRTQMIWMITTIVAVLGLVARTNIFG